MKYWVLTGVCFLLFGTACLLQGQSVDVGIFNEPAESNLLEVRMRPTKDIKNGQYSAGVFTIRTRASTGIVLEAPAALNNELFGYVLQTKGTDGAFDYFIFTFIGSYTIDWDASIEYPVAKLSCQGLCEQATFEIVDNAWTELHNGNFYQEINANQALTGFYEPTVRLVVGSPLPPAISCPENQVLRAQKENESFVNNGIIPDAQGSDNCPGYSVEYSFDRVPRVTYATLKGLPFPKGLTTISAKITDVTGLTSHCTFTVTVFN